MPKWYRAQVVVQHDGGLPANAITNTWHYLNGQASPNRTTDAGAFQGQLELFYDTWVPELGSSDYDWANVTVKHYDFSDPQPRIPFNEGSMDITTPLAGRNDLPAEVAVTLSMEGVRESGVNMRRRRGRIYCGPIAMGSADIPVLPTVNAEIVADAAEAAFFPVPAVDVKLAVYSRSEHYGKAVGEPILEEDDEIPANLGTSFNEVVRLWVDNAWDTQRRRGRGPTAREIRLRP